MLMRMLNTFDYNRSLRRRRLMALGLLAVGVTGVVCYFLLVRNSEALSGHVRGFYLGGATGITAGALVLLVRTQYLLTHPEARKNAQVKEQDEREKTIISQAFQFAGLFTVFCAAASTFVLVTVSLAAARAVLAVIALFCTAFLLAYFYLSAKL